MTSVPSDAGSNQSPKSTFEPESVLTVSRLTRYLREAKIAHSEYEKTTGVPDLDWPEFYSRFIIAKSINEGF